MVCFMWFYYTALTTSELLFKQCNIFIGCDKKYVLMAHKVVLELTPVEFHRTSKGGNGKPSGHADIEFVKVIPVVLNFQRLFEESYKGGDVFPEIPNKDLYHAAAALYETSLSEVTEDVIYPAICDKWSRTILLIQEQQDALEQFKSRCISRLSNDTPSEGIKIRCKNDADIATYEDGTAEIKATQILENPVVHNYKEANAMGSEQPGDHAQVPNGSCNLMPAKEEESRFAHVFSDMESNESDEEDDETEDYMSGVDDFLKNIKERKEEKERWLESVRSNDCSGEPSSLTGIEHRLLACATFEQSYKKPGHKVIHLTLIAVRKRFRKMGLGSFMARVIRNPTLAGRYDAIVVNADHNATDFFEKEGFNGDVLLNSKYAEIGDTWFNCKRMCYLPPYQTVLDSMEPQTTPDAFLTELEDVDIKQMELDIALYEEKSLQAYQAQSAIVQRLRKEVILLRARVSAQHDAMQKLVKENHAIRDAKLSCEKELLKMRLSAMNIAAENLLNFESDANGVDVEDHDVT